MEIEPYGDLAREILTRPPRLGRIRLVAVDGPSGSGKTVFAERLAAAVATVSGTPAPVVHTDDFLDGWDDQFTFWSRLEEWVLAPLRAGLIARYRPYVWERAAFVGELVEVPPAPVVVMEGVSAARAEIRPELTFSAFVVAPLRTRAERSLLRDGDAQQPYLMKWRLREDRHFAGDATAHHVDLVVDGARPDPRPGFARAERPA